MKLFTHTLTALLLSSACLAEVSPTTCASLGVHMLEVNKEWSDMWPEIACSDQQISFSNEAERIGLHLRLVSTRLSIHAEAEKRSLLSSLRTYADAGVFPQNYVLPTRNPVFIDPHGTACAVGHLMRVSGAEELANMIDDSSELKYIMEMDLSLISDWAHQFGFTPEELAWIQPGYPPSTSWTAPGGGVNGKVNAMITRANGDLVLAGHFNMGNQAMNNVAIWDGSNYTILGSNGLSGIVNDLIEFNGELYAAGSFYFLNAYSDLVKFDGTNWQYMNALPGFPVTGFDLHEHDGELYIAGAGDGFGGTSHMVAALQNGNWNLIGEQMNDTIRTLETYENELYAGGDFTETIGGQTLIDHVAVLDGNGNWQEAFGGLNGEVHDLHSFYGNLYVGGELGDLANPLFGLAVRYPTDPGWTEHIPGHENDVYAFDGRTVIRTIGFYGAQLFAGGNFDVQPLLGTTGQNVMWVDAGSGTMIPQATSNGPVYCMTEGPNTSIFIGGAFDSLNYQTAPHIAWSDVSVMSVPENEQAAIAVWPCPSNGTLNVSIPQALIGETLMIRDITGKLVHQHRGIGLQETLDLRHLVQGTYSVQVAGSGLSELFVLSGR